MKEVDQLYWFYSIWWEEQEYYVDCLVDLNILDVQELNEGYWLIQDKNRFVLKSLEKLCSGIVLGKAKRWSVELW